MNEVNQRRVQELDSKRLIDTVEVITVKGLVATVTTNQSLFLEGKHKNYIKPKSKRRQLLSLKEKGAS